MADRAYCRHTGQARVWVFGGRAFLSRIDCEQRRDADVTPPDATDTQVIPVKWQRPQWSGEQEWINEYYRSVPDADVAAAKEERLTSRAQAHREVGKTRSKGDVCVDVREDQDNTVL